MLHYARDHGVRPAACALPISTHFCDGVGAALYVAGQPVVSRPWTGLGETTLGPSFGAHLAAAGLGWLAGPCDEVPRAESLSESGEAPPAGACDAGGWLLPLLPSAPCEAAASAAARGGDDDGGVASPSGSPSPLAVCTSHHAAWAGGSCLLLTGAIRLVAGQGGVVRRAATGYAALRLLALALPMHAQPAAAAQLPPTTPSGATPPRSRSLCVALVYRVEVARLQPEGCYSGPASEPATGSPEVAAAELAEADAAVSLAPLLLLSSGHLLRPSHWLRTAGSVAAGGVGDAAPAWRECTASFDVPATEEGGSKGAPWQLHAVELLLGVCVRAVVPHGGPASTGAVHVAVALGALRVFLDF